MQSFNPHLKFLLKYGEIELLKSDVTTPIPDELPLDHPNWRKTDILIRKMKKRHRRYNELIKNMDALIEERKIGWNKNNDITAEEIIKQKEEKEDLKKKSISAYLEKARSRKKRVTEIGYSTDSLLVKSKEMNLIEKKILIPEVIYKKTRNAPNKNGHWTDFVKFEEKDEIRMSGNSPILIKKIQARCNTRKYYSDPENLKLQKHRTNIYIAGKKLEKQLELLEKIPKLVETRKKENEEKRIELNKKSAENYHKKKNDPEFKKKDKKQNKKFREKNPLYRKGYFLINKK